MLIFSPLDLPHWTTNLRILQNRKRAGIDVENGNLCFFGWGAKVVTRNNACLLIISILVIVNETGFVPRLLWTSLWGCAIPYQKTTRVGALNSSIYSIFKMRFWRIYTVNCWFFTDKSSVKTCQKKRQSVCQLAEDSYYLLFMSLIGVHIIIFPRFCEAHFCPLKFAQRALPIWLNTVMWIYFQPSSGLSPPFKNYDLLRLSTNLKSSIM